MNPLRTIACCFCALALAQAATPPRVLILGDTVYRQPVTTIAKEIAGKIEIVRPDLKSGEMFSSATVLANLDELLGEGKWDLIIFNAGIGDLIHRAPGMETFRVMPVSEGGIRNTSDEDYAKNLNELAQRLKATRAKLVWASTTPIKDNFVFIQGSEIQANAIAAKVMAAQRIPILDMHEHITRITADISPRAPQWETFGSNKVLIHEPIIELIRKQLSLR